MAEISVIVATYNRCESIKDTLDSLLCQESDGSFNYEVIVVDNNSSDKTKDTIESYYSRFNGRLKYLFEPKQGKSYALNKGIKEAKGEIVVFTDDDAIVDKQWLKNVKMVFENQDYIGVGGKTSLKWPLREPDWFLKKGKYRMNGPVAMHDYGERSIEYTNEMSPPIGVNMAFRSLAFRKYGGFKVELGHAGEKRTRKAKAEDIEIGRRLISAGERIIYSPNMIVYHKISRDRATKRYFRKWYSACGRNNALIEQFQGKSLFILGIPLWIYRKLVICLSSFLVSAISCNPKLIFYWELQSISTFSRMNEFIRLKFKHDTHRH